MYSVTYEEEISAIEALISSNAGFGVDLFAILQVHRLEDGTYAMLETDPLTNEEHERLFETANNAAQAFVERRHTRQLAFDYERESVDS